MEERIVQCVFFVMSENWPGGEMTKQLAKSLVSGSLDLEDISRRYALLSDVVPDKYMSGEFELDELDAKALQNKDFRPQPCMFLRMLDASSCKNSYTDGSCLERVILLIICGLTWNKKLLRSVIQLEGRITHSNKLVESYRILFANALRLALLTGDVKEVFYAAYNECQSESTRELVRKAETQNEVKTNYQHEIERVVHRALYELRTFVDVRTTIRSLAGMSPTYFVCSLILILACHSGTNVKEPLCLFGKSQAYSVLQSIHMADVLTRLPEPRIPKIGAL